MERVFPLRFHATESAALTVELQGHELLSLVEREISGKSGLLFRCLIISCQLLKLSVTFRVVLLRGSAFKIPAKSATSTPVN